MEDLEPKKYEVEWAGILTRLVFALIWRFLFLAPFVYVIFTVYLQSIGE